MRRSGLLWLEGTEVHKKRWEKKWANLEEVDVNAAPPLITQRNITTARRWRLLVYLVDKQSKRGAESESGLQRDCCVAIATVFALNQ